MPAPRRHRFLATCAPGLEPWLLAEVRGLGLARAEGQPGGTTFAGTLLDAGRANLWLRTASRVLLLLGSFPAPDEASLYAGVRDLDFSPWLAPDGSLAVVARASRSRLDHGMFIAQRVKDAVADRFRAESGRRPSVDREDPDLRLHAYLHSDVCRLFADTSGEPLFKRGWRRVQGPAPLKETVAAGCLLASGWDRRSPLLDPFCGSGTILVEAATLAAGMAPGRSRDSFCFERWPVHRPEPWLPVREEARAAGALPPKVILEGRDSDPSAVEAARENLRSAGFGERVKVELGGIADFRPRPGWNAWVVTNPPWGERLGEVPALRGLYARFGAVLRERCGGYTAAVLCSRPELLGRLGLRSDRRIPLRNGPLDCRLAVCRMPRPGYSTSR